MLICNIGLLSGVGKEDRISIRHPHIPRPWNPIRASPDFNPIEHLWKKVKKEATHLKYFPEFTHLQAEVDRALLYFAQTPREITVLMARYCDTLGAMAA